MKILRVLTPNEAIHIVTLQDHPEAEQGSVAFDVALIDMLRDGIIEAVTLSTGQLAFRRGPNYRD